MWLEQKSLGVGSHGRLLLKFDIEMKMSHGENRKILWNDKVK